MTCLECIDRLADHGDGPDSDVARDVREHLQRCASCSAVAEDLVRVRRHAATLGPIAPPAAVWTRLADTLALSATAGDGQRWGGRQSLAAAAGLVLVASGLAWLGAALHVGAPQVTPVVDAGRPGFQLAEAAYQTTIEDLESVTSAVEPASGAEPTLVALETSLADLDRVIGETRASLAREPADTFTQDMLLAALDSKVALLEDTVVWLDGTGAGEGVVP